MSKILLRLSALVVAAVMLSASAVDAQPRSKKLDRVLNEVVAANAAGKQRVIVRLKAGAGARARQQLKALGVTPEAEHPLIDAVSVEVDTRTLKALEASDAFETISFDAEVTAHARKGLLKKLLQAVQKSYTEQSLSTLRGTLGLTGSETGRGVGVALIDSGIAPLDSFQGRIAGFYDFTKCKSGNGKQKPCAPRASRPYDDYGHGTHVAGLIGGMAGYLDAEFMGVAPAVHFLGLKVLDKDGGGRASNVIAAIQFAIANKQAFGIDIINLSLGHPIFQPAASDPLVQAVEAAVRAGLTVVVSAGNFGVNPTTGEPGYAGITSPGNAPSAITVGAVNHQATVDRGDDRVAVYSSRGPTWYDGFAKPDIVAPGHMLASDASPLSTLVQGLPGLARRAPSGRSLLQLSGTSMAAGVTSGVVATLIEAGRAANGGVQHSPNALKAILQFTAIPVSDGQGGLADGLTQGTGGANAAGALAVVRGTDPRARRGTSWVTKRVRPTTAIGETTWTWAQNIVWGNNIVWGDNIVWGNNIVWGQNIVWGDNIVWGNNIVWGLDWQQGDNIVWGNTFVDGDNIVWGNNIVWGQNIVWGFTDGDNIVWGQDDNIVWGNLYDDNIVWGNFFDDNIVWGNNDDNIVWGQLAGGRR
ncbi:MAG: S8 family serine peptidase [Acidobacteriota bacterium]|nr:S8 family serine peptidase [Acidobacteriota bacterium]